MANASLYAWGWLEALVKEEFRIKAETGSGVSTRFWSENYSPVYRANKAPRNLEPRCSDGEAQCSNSIAAAFLRYLPSPSVMNSIMLRNTYEISLVVQGLGLQRFYFHGFSSILSQGTKILKPHGTTKKRKKYLWPQTSRARPPSHCSLPKQVSLQKKVS